MISKVRSDPMAFELFKLSSLTDAQLDSLLISRMEGNLSSKATMREKKGVSKGAFARTLSQGERNVEASVYTLLLLGYLGVVEPSVFTQMARVGELISKLKDVQAEREEVARVTRAVDEFARGFSKRGRKRFIL